MGIFCHMTLSLSPPRVPSHVPNSEPRPSSRTLPEERWCPTYYPQRIHSNPCRAPSYRLPSLKSMIALAGTS